MIGREMVMGGFATRLALRVAFAGALAYAPFATGCVVAEAAGLAHEHTDEDVDTTSDVNAGPSGSVDTGEQALVVRRGSLPDYTPVQGPHPDPWRTAGPHPDPWNPGDAPATQTPKKPGSGKD